MPSLAEQFLARFRALDRWHGVYSVKDASKSAKGKVQGNAYGTFGPATIELWQQHLDGAEGLGLCPITDAGTCWFGALDIDIYNLDLSKLATDIAAIGLPLLPTRTKSGGCHLYIFGAEALPAKLVRAKLGEWAAALGFSGCEIFPKQEKLSSKADTGNWINMPYFDCEHTVRYGLDAVGKAMSAEAYLAAATTLALTEAQLDALLLKKEDAFMTDGPPCLETLCASGFPEGTRNEGLFNLGIYAQKKYGDNFEKYLDEYNAKYMEPPLGLKEISGLIRTLNKKRYFYRCNNPPINAHCNKQLCLTRLHGIGGSAEDAGVDFGGLVKLETDPAMWILTVNGRGVELDTEELVDQRRCRLRILETANILLRPIKKAAWDKLIQDKISGIEIREVPQDILPQGQWRHLLEEFCTSRAAAGALDEIILGRPYSCPVEKRTFFRAADFALYLKRHHARFDERKVYNWLRAIKARNHQGILKGKFTNYWSVPEFTKQTEEYAVPKAKDGDII